MATTAVGNLRMARLLILADGQSLNFYGGFPAKTRDALATLMNDGIAVSNVWVGARPWTPDLAASRSERLSPYIGGGRKCVVTMNGGQSDVWNGDDGQSIYDDMVTYALACKALGVHHVVALTIPPNTTNTGGQDTARAAANTLILAAAGGAAFDAVADVATAYPTAGDTSIYVDGTHLTTTGAQGFANLTAAAIFSIPNIAVG